MVLFYHASRDQKGLRPSLTPPHDYGRVYQPLMTLIKFRHNYPPLFAKRDRQKRLLNLIKRLIYIIITITILGLTFYYLNNNLETDKNSKIISTVNQSPKQKIISIVVPHHDLVKNQRSTLFKTISNDIQKTKTVILISPNHFNTGSANILTMTKSWQLPTKTITPDLLLINELLKNNFIKNDQLAFSGEHGITNILQDIADFLPQAKIAPIIIKEDSSLVDIKQLAANIQKQLDGQTLIIASVDFSHYQPAALADLHDLLSIRALENNNLEAIWSDIEVDCPACLYVSAKVAGDKKYHFTLADHTNSGILEKSRDAETTTHVFGYYQKEERKENKEESSTFIFAGDIMLDRLINHQFLDNKIFDLFSEFGNRVFWGTDISIANLEGPIADQPIIDDFNPANLNFNFPPKTAEVLAWLHLKTVGLANNHTLNAGDAGFAITKKVLTDQGISSFGHQVQLGDFSVFRSKNGDIPISVIGINALNKPPQLELEEMIKREKNNSHFVIIFPHWGNEYQTTHSPQQEQWARQWISWGADLIIGSHPHVVQDVQMIEGTPVFYSIGNFVFDQTFSQETQTGLILAGKITKDNIEIIPLPTVQLNLKPKLVQGENKTKIINSLISQLGLTDQSADNDLGTIVIPRK